MAREIRLSAGQHRAPFDKRGEATMCVQEYTSYLAGEPHSYRPRCVSPLLTRFMVLWNDALDDKTRQRLRPYAVRQIGTAGDGQDKVRSYMAFDWFVRTCAPAFLEAAGLTKEADWLRGLAAIVGMGEAEEAARRTMDAIWGVRKAAASYVTRAADWEATKLPVSEAAGYAAAGTAGYAAGFGREIDLETAGEAAIRTAWEIVRGGAYVAAEDTLRLTVKGLQESAFLLLDRMIDPAGLHDIKDEAACFEETGREPLVIPAV